MQTSDAWEASWGKYLAEPAWNRTPPAIDIEQGIRILQEKGLRGDRTRLESIVESYGYDELALRLLANYLASYHSGSLYYLDRIPVLHDTQPKGRSARRVLAAYEARLEGETDSALLYLISMFDRPVPWAYVEHLIAAMKVPTTSRISKDSYSKLLVLLKWRTAKQRLATLGILQLHGLIETVPGVDGQPRIFMLKTVRDYFNNQLQLRYNDVWRQAQAYLFVYFKQAAGWKTIEQPDMLRQAIVHGCGAGYHQLVWDELYAPNMSLVAEDDAGRQLYLLRGFFAACWQETVRLNDKAQLAVFELSARSLLEMEERQQAILAYESAFQLCAKSRHWQQALPIISQLRKLYVAEGDKNKAVEITRYGMAYAHLSGDMSSLEQNSRRLAVLLGDAESESVSDKPTHLATEHDAAHTVTDDAQMVPAVAAPTVLTVPPNEASPVVCLSDRAALAIVQSKSKLRGQRHREQRHHGRRKGRRSVRRMPLVRSRSGRQRLKRIFR